MTYFELFDIPVQLKVNRSELSAKYFELSRKYHPDYFVSEPEDVQQEALEKTALLNKAWTTFANTDDTIRYVLMQKDLMEPEEKFELPPAFLGEVMDLNEAIMDGEDPSGIASKLEKLQKEIYEPVASIIENYKEGQATTPDLLLVKEYYYKKRYLDRMQRELQTP